jgi:hypothetical protein
MSSKDDKCTVCDGKAIWPISEAERAAIVNLPKTMPLNNNCAPCDVSGKESVRLRREADGRNERRAARIAS